MMIHVLKREMENFLSCLLLCVFFSWISIQVLHSFVSSRRRRSKANPRRLRLPPGPKPFPLIGNLLEIGDKPHVSMTKLSQRYGPIMSLQLGQITTVVVSSPTMAKQILRTHDQSLCYRTVPDAVQAAKHGEYGISWVPISDRWRNLRRICKSQLFATKILDANQGLRRIKVQELINDVHNSMVAGKAVDIGKAAFKTTLNLLSRTVFSVDLADTSSETAREFKEVVWGIMEEAAKPNLADYFPVLRKIDPQGIRRRMTNHFRKMMDLFGQFIIQRLESRKRDDYVTNNDMLDTLLNISEENEDMDKTEIEHLFLDLFAAGADTTATTLEWAMAELLRHPESLSKAQAEMEQIIGRGKQVEESDITRLPYLQAIIKEIFRLHPTVPLLLPHKAEADVEIGGYTVPKGAQVLVNAWAIGRDPSIWDKPTSFMPERFLGLDQIDVLGRNFELIPFGSGRRICPGLPLAMRMLQLMLGSLLNSFDWKLEDGVLPETINMEEKFGLTLQMAQPLTLQKFGV